MEKEPVAEAWWVHIARDAAREMIVFKNGFEAAFTSAVYHGNAPRDHIDAKLKEEIRQKTLELLKKPEEL